MARHSYKRNPASLVLVNPGKPPKRKAKKAYKPRNQPPPHKWYKGKQPVPAKPSLKRGDTVYVGQPVVAGPRKKPIKGRPSAGWYWVDRHKRGSAKVRGYSRYFENPTGRSKMAKRKVRRKRPVRKTALVKRTTRRVVRRRKTAKRNPRRRATRSLKRRVVRRKRAIKRNPVRKARRVMRRKGRKVARRRYSLKRNPRRSMRRRGGLKRRSIRRRRAYRNPFDGMELLKKSVAGAGGFLAARLMSNLIVRYGASAMPSLVQHAGLLGNVAAVALAYYVPKKVKALAPYRMPMVIGAGVSLVVDLVDRYLIPQAPSLAPWIGPATYIGTYEAALQSEGAVGEYISMGEYVRSPLGEYVETGDQIGQAMGGGLFGNPSDEVEMLQGFGMLDGDEGTSPFDVRILNWPGQEAATYPEVYKASGKALSATVPVQIPMQGAPQEVLAISGKVAGYAPSTKAGYGVNPPHEEGIFGKGMFN